MVMLSKEQYVPIYLSLYYPLGSVSIMQWITGANDEDNPNPASFPLDTYRVRTFRE
jgi:hypothetical protein